MAAVTAVAVGTRLGHREEALQQADVVSGIRAMSVLAVSYLPFALLVGSAAATSANPMAAWLGTWVIYGGAAHLAVLAVLAQGSSWWAAALVGLLVNARLAAYATSMAPVWRTAPARLRLLAAVLLTDAPWALASARPTGRRGVYLGAAVMLFLCWPLMVTVGLLVGDRLTLVPVITLLPALTLGSVVVTQLRQRPVAWAVGAASATAVVTAPLDVGTAFALCASAGVAAGALARGGARS